MLTAGDYNMTPDDFIRALLEAPNDPRKRLEDFLRAFEPSMYSADYPTYTCRECGQAYRGPLCGHCGARNYHVGPDLAGWPAGTDWE